MALIFAQNIPSGEAIILVRSTLKVLITIPLFEQNCAEFLRSYG